MSRRATDWAWRTPTRGLARLTLLALARKAGPDGVCKVSQPELCVMTGLDRKVLRNQLERLGVDGLLKVDAGIGRQSSTYALPIDSEVSRGGQSTPSGPGYREGVNRPSQRGSIDLVRGGQSTPSGDAEGLFPGVINNPPTPQGGSRRRKAAVRDTAEFQRFWDTYGHKIAIAKAEAAWTKALARPDVTADLLIERATAYRARETAKGKWPEFAAHPATWLNQERYLDQAAKATNVYSLSDNPWGDVVNR